jgi:predicted transcriptional regulator
MKRSPTDAELAILKVLWRQGPQTVRQVHEALGTGGAYTTTLKMLQIMLDKQLVTRDASQRSHVYSAAVGEEDTQRALVTDLVDKAFEGSAAKMAMHALSLKDVSPDEIAELQHLIDAYEKGER